MSDKSLHDYLRHAAEAFTVRSYLEIGCREGDSLREVVAHSKVLTRVVVCDEWGACYGGTGRGGHDHIDGLLNRLGYTGERLFLDGNSRQLVPTLQEQFDLVLVDGDHSCEGAVADLTNCWKLVHPGGQLVFHDIAHIAHKELRELFGNFMDVQDDCGHRQENLEGHGLAVAWKT